MDIVLIIGIILALAGGILSGVVAEAKNRDPVGWGIIGAIFPLLGLIAIAGMPTARRTKRERAVPMDVGKPTETAKRTETISNEDKASRAIILLSLIGVTIAMVVLAYGFTLE